MENGVEVFPKRQWRMKMDRKGGDELPFGMLAEQGLAAHAPPHLRSGAGFFLPWLFFSGSPALSVTSSSHLP